MPDYRRYIAACLFLNLLAHAAIFLEFGPPPFKAGALFFIVTGPGLLVTPLMLARDRQVQAWPERVLLGLAAGAALFPLVMLFLSYLPGPLSLLQVLAAFDLLTAGAALWGWLWVPRHAGNAGRLLTGPGYGKPSPRGTRPVWTLWPTLALLSVLLLTAYFRLANLGYAELQGDEAKVVLHAIAALQGDEDVLFVHRRGPADVLAPALVATLDTPLTESLLRLPFALISIVVVGILFLLGQAVRSTMTGWLAGLLLAGEGLFVAFARIVQYQAFIHLSAAGTLYLLFLLYRAVEEDRGVINRRLLRNYLLLAALFFSTGLLAHYEAVIVVFPAAYLLWRMVRNGLPPGELARGLIWPAMVSLAVTLAFYLPFFLDPRFQETVARYSEKVVGDFQAIFDHLALLLERGSFYNFYLSFWLMLALLGFYPLQAYWRDARAGRRIIGIVGMLALWAAMARVLLSPVPESMATPLLVGVFLLVALFAPKATTGERMLWLWLGPAMFLSLFLIRDPNLHFYIFFAPWALLVAIVLDGGWLALRGALPLRAAQALAGALVLLFLLPRLAYAHQLFIRHDVEIQRNWPTQAALPGWMEGSDPAGHPIFGFPHNSGWKTVGMLYDAGVLQGSYNTNIRDWIGAWYTRSAELCEENPDWVILETVERPEDQAELREAMGDRYVKRGEIYVGDRLGIELYGRNHEHVEPPVRYQAEEYAAAFDQDLADPDLHPVVPELDPDLDPVYYRFGDELALTGYRLYRDEAQPGDALSLLLRWELLAAPEQDLVLFTQVLGDEARKLGQRDTAVACSEGPVTDWEAGDVAVGHYRIPLDAEAPAGEFPLIFGLYGREDGDRLPIFDGDGNLLGDMLNLSRITLLTPAVDSRW